MKVILVYKTDSWHSYSSRDIIGIATTTENAVLICQKKDTKEGEKIDKTQLWNLNNLKQTQGYSGDGEFQYEELKTDVLF